MCVATREISEPGQGEIFCCCEDGTYFVPEAVGLPADRLDEYERNEDDHMTLELIGIEETDESATEYVSASVVLARFREIGPDGWGRFV